MIPRWIVVLAWRILDTLVGWMHGPYSDARVWHIWATFWVGRGFAHRALMVQYALEDYAMDRGWSPWKGASVEEYECIENETNSYYHGDNV